MGRLENSEDKMSLINEINVLPTNHRNASIQAPDLSLLTRMAETFGRWRDRARGRAELARLNEHQLQDIGISWLEAETEWRKPFWRP
jgi:uncharacterized protein YjiS (DUF1127 family)